MAPSDGQGSPWSPADLAPWRTQAELEHHRARLRIQSPSEKAAYQASLPMGSKGSPQTTPSHHTQAAAAPASAPIEANKRPASAHPDPTQPVAQGQANPGPAPQTSLFGSAPQLCDQVVPQVPLKPLRTHDEVLATPAPPVPSTVGTRPSDSSIDLPLNTRGWSEASIESIPQGLRKQVRTLISNLDRAYRESSIFPATGRMTEERFWRELNRMLLRFERQDLTTVYLLEYGNMPPEIRMEVWKDLFRIRDREMICPLFDVDRLEGIQGWSVGAVAVRKPVVTSIRGYQRADRHRAPYIELRRDSHIPWNYLYCGRYYNAETHTGLAASMNSDCRAWFETYELAKCSILADPRKQNVGLAQQIARYPDSFFVNTRAIMTCRTQAQMQSDRILACDEMAAICLLLGRYRSATKVQVPYVVVVCLNVRGLPNGAIICGDGNSDRNLPRDPSSDMKVGLRYSHLATSYGTPVNNLISLNHKEVASLLFDRVYQYHPRAKDDSDEAVDKVRELAAMMFSQVEFGGWHEWRDLQDARHMGGSKRFWDESLDVEYRW